jgi:RNA polymerase sigma factor (TIGR02999 family)
MSESGNQVTLLLDAVERGDARAADELFPLVYEELRQRAGKLLSLERREHTLQRTALVHEAYLRLVRAGSSFQTRLHFFNAAALAMRRILLNHAAQHGTAKRGGGRGRVDLDDLDAAAAAAAAARPPGESMDWIELDEALKRLEAASPRQHQVVMLRFFSGRTEREIAQMLGVSEPTVRRDWATARLWLYRAIQSQQK